MDEASVVHIGQLKVGLEKSNNKLNFVLIEDVLNLCYDTGGDIFRPFACPFYVLQKGVTFNLVHRPRLLEKLMQPLGCLSDAFIMLDPCDFCLQRMTRNAINNQKDPKAVTTQLVNQLEDVEFHMVR